MGNVVGVNAVSRRPSNSSRLSPSPAAKSRLASLDKCPIGAMQAFVLHRLRRDGAGDAGINRPDAPKVMLCRVSVSRTV
jgi:hypothetical protein